MKKCIMNDESVAASEIIHYTTVCDLTTVPSPLYICDGERSYSCHERRLSFYISNVSPSISISVEKQFRVKNGAVGVPAGYNLKGRSGSDQKKDLNKTKM